MSNERTGLYEGMFLFPQSATANLQDAVNHLKTILEKSSASIINLRKWDDRRLAYEIEGNKRGVYFLVYFNAPTSSISDLERRCSQSEELLRMMVTRAEHLPKEIIEANDGSEELASEIKLRGDQSTEKGSSAESKISRKEDENPESTSNGSDMKPDDYEEDAEVEGEVEEIAEEVTEG
ncbi:MAG: 30S ribosomal protein S6 [Phycisphaerales bacterium]|jgi:small subunit ribosomal protein S6|nr:30S ribosomal protein S6 [Phycisphaerales bacterium]